MIMKLDDNLIDEIKVEFSNQNIKIRNIKRVEKLLIYNTVFISYVSHSDPVFS